MREVEATREAAVSCNVTCASRGNTAKCVCWHDSILTCCAPGRLCGGACLCVRVRVHARACMGGCAVYVLCMFVCVCTVYVLCVCVCMLVCVLCMP